MKRVLCLLLAALPLLVGAVGTNTVAKISPIVFADRENAQRFIANNTKYYQNLCANEIEFKMQKKGATLQELKAFAQEQARDFTVREQELIRRGYESLMEKVKAAKLKLPPIERIVFIRTTQLEECGASAYTHYNQIYTGETIFRLLSSGAPARRLQGEELLAHEIFHCLTRNNPQFRKDLYKLIGFTVVGKEFKMPKTIRDYYISNPDVNAHDSYATFKINGKQVQCWTALVTTHHFQGEGDVFFRCMETMLVPVKGGKPVSKDKADNFWEVFGRNTGYVIDPEETLADNFAMALVYGAKGPTGQGYPTQKLIDDILKYLTDKSAK